MYTLPTITNRQAFAQIQDWYTHLDMVQQYVGGDIARRAGVTVDVTACGYGLFTVSSPDAGAANVAAHWLLMTGAAQVIGKVDDTAPTSETCTGRMYFYLQAL